MSDVLDVRTTKLDGVVTIKPHTNFEDFRGSYVETYNRRLYTDAGIDVEFLEDDISTSTKHVLRGIHGDQRTWKLISCLWGKFYLVVVNWDETSPQYKQWESFVLSDRNRMQVLVPPKFGNGHLVLSEEAIFQYKQSAYYHRTGQFTVMWNDPDLDIWWPIKQPILSERDEGNDRS
jgi:dTDP-4-dehydrorhamnose 3,5-epimerase